MTDENVSIKQSTENQHQITEVIDNQSDAHYGEIVSICSCGAEWSHPRTRSKQERINIELAHKTYGQKIRPDIST